MEEKSDASDYGAGEWGLLRMFKRDFEKNPMLSRDEELLVAGRAKTGDLLAVNLLVESNIRFVVHVVFKYWHPGLPLMDLISEGCKGLIQAAKKFDPERGVRFITYAYPAVGRMVYDASGDHYRNRHISLDEPLRDKKGNVMEDMTLQDLLVSHDAPADEVAANKQVHRALVALDERERRIIVLRFWMDLGMNEIAARMGLSRSYVERIEHGALRKMRWMLTGGFKTDQKQLPELVGLSASACEA